MSIGHNARDRWDASPRAHEGATLLPFPGVSSTERPAENPVLVGTSAPMRRVLELVQKLGPKDITVLVAGETGTGKELVASSLHAASRRAGRPCVRLNCAAIPRELVEAELFGHTRGAFTGATQPRSGFFGAAHTGTLVLDEVEALPLEAQAKLLRAVQQGEVQTVGTDSVRKVDVRVIACTNVDLAAEVRAGRFRKDLYYRLAVATIELPPLRARVDDIAPLARHFAQVYAQRFDVGPIRFGDGLLDGMQALLWPGNVRELENAVASMVALCDEGLLTSSLMPSIGESDIKGVEPAPAATDFRSQVRAFERNILIRALEAGSNNRSETARRLGMSRTTLLDLLRRHGLWVPHDGRDKACVASDQP
jgi:two-component system response regulator AtoC